jgi:hypothetical protein
MSSAGIIGSVGRVTVSIPPQGYGEIVLELEGMTRAFAATSGGDDKEIPLHSRVAVVEQTGASTVLVTPC